MYLRPKDALQIRKCIFWEALCVKMHDFCILHFPVSQLVNNPVSLYLQLISLEGSTPTPPTSLLPSRPGYRCNPCELSACSTPFEELSSFFQLFNFPPCLIIFQNPKSPPFNLTPLFIMNLRVVIFQCFISLNLDIEGKITKKSP